ncbi:hypothetical protein Rsub_08619 [Raphidocelis subcapitata]|uniref:C2 domain-containing protein n=1 Tax=Raphidocelis subcapitata TaxID=307507 RepID=A0A2V0PEN9_9CHLO|nr:hypothetical protein Rsub_08619 [Raphidocelis subcapitata]|eukprot:GBF95637.1 hypothetical protein Rsub_08619 [Raphidocelis subcapitata]
MTSGGEPPAGAAGAAASADAAAPAASAAPTPLPEQRFLCISVREARNLVAKDYETASSDPFAKITLGPHSKKSRVIYRNRHPLWQQRLLFPLEGLDEGEPLLIELYDKDFAGIEFLGQVIMTLGKALEIAEDEVTGRAYWFPLAKKRSTDIVGGELCLGFEPLSAASAAQVASEVEAQMDPEALAAALSRRALHVRLHGINGLKANGLLAPGGAAVPAARGGGGRAKVGPRARSLVIRLGRFCLEKPLPPGFDEQALQGEFELPINEEVLIPLASALRAGSLSTRRRDEIYDIKITIKGTTHTIAKTQIPIWDVPIEDAPTPAPEADRGDAAAAAAAPLTPLAAAAAAAAAPFGHGGAGSRPATPPAGGRAGSRGGSRAGTPPPRLVTAAPTDEQAAMAAEAVAAAIARAGGAHPVRLETLSAPAGAPGGSPGFAGIAQHAGAAGPLPKKRALGASGDGGGSAPATPRGGGAAFVIPAHQPGDASADDEFDAVADASIVPRSKSEGCFRSPADAAAATAALSGGLREQGPLGLRARSTASCGSGKGALLAAASVGSQGGEEQQQLQQQREEEEEAQEEGSAAAASSLPSPVASPLAQPRGGRWAGPLQYVPGSAGYSDLSRRLRSMLGREAWRAAAAPAPPPAIGRGGSLPASDDEGGAAAAAAAAPPPAAPRDLASSSWGSAWRGGGGGKRYVRTLESHLPLTSANLEVGLSLRLVPLPSEQAAPEAVAVAAEGPARVLVDEEDDEDVPDAAPLPLPPPLGTPLIDAPVALGVNSLHALLFGGSSPFMDAFWASEDLRDVRASTWAAGGDPVSPGGPAPLRGRRVSYVKPLRIPIPLAPKQCNVWEEHRLVAKTDGGFVVECRSTNDAPKGDCFYVDVQLAGTHVASGQSRLRISMQIVFHRSCLGRSMIQSGAEADARRGWAALAAALHRHAAAAAGAAAPLAVGPALSLAAAPAAAAAAGAAEAGALAATGLWPARRARLGLLLGGGGAAGGDAVMLGCVVVALCVLSFAVWRAGGAVSAEIRELSLAVAELRDAYAAAAAAGAACPQGLEDAAARLQASDFMNALRSSAGAGALLR